VTVKILAAIRRLFAPVAPCEVCGKPSAGFAVRVRPKRVATPGRLQTDLKVTGAPMPLCPRHLEEYREDPGGF
jgi:hypothetical protein